MLIMLLFCVTLVVLYQKSVNVDLNQLYRSEATIRAMIAKDLEVESELMMLAQGRVSHYDTLNKEMLELDHFAQKLAESLGHIKALNPQLEAVYKTLELQREPVELFKMRLSVLRNSIRYLPTLLKESLTTHPDKAKLFMFVYQELLLLSSHPAEFDMSPLLASMQYLDRQEYQNINHHLEVVLQNYLAVEAAMQAFASSDVEAASAALETKAHHWFDEEVASAEKYRLILLLFTVLLVIYIVYIWLNLRKSGLQLKESNRFLHYLQKAMDDHAIISITDQRGDITYVNEKFCAISGYTEAELIGKNHRIIKTDEHDPSVFKEMWTTIANGKTWYGIIKNRKKDGSFYWVESSITPFLNEAGKPWQYISVRTDITEQVAVKQKLKESYEHYRMLSETIPYALCIVSNGKWEYLNPAAVKMFGASSYNELLDHEVLLVVAAEDKARVEQQLTLAIEKGRPIPLQEVKLLLCDGEVIDAEIQGSVLNRSGEKSILLAMHNITERKQLQAEYKQYTEQLEHTQRLESLGVLAGGIAHDFNNILTSIMGNISLAEVCIHDPDETLGYIHKVSTASDRAADLCQQMLAYSGGGVFEKEAVQLEGLLMDVLEITSTTMGNKVKLEQEIATDLPSIIADSRQIQQVILNLLTNANEAIEEEGTIRVELGIMDVDEDWLADTLKGQNIPLGRYVFVEVQDSGCGMDEATKAKIFDPFFTTKFTGRGLGMSAMLGIVDAHDGALSLKTEKGVGTTFRVVFPVSNQVAGDKADSHAEALAERKGSGTILVIDDETSILEFTTAALTRSGFEVITASDGEEGVAQFKAQQSHIVAVICDMVMPKLSGAEVAKAVHEMAPEVCIILSSGFDEDALEVGKDVLSGFIHKPYRLKTLVTEVHRALDRKK